MSFPDPSSNLAPGIYAAPSSLRFQYARSSGPGGQNVNKVNTKVELWILIGDLVGLSPAAAERLRRIATSHLTLADEIHLTSDATRSQGTNRRHVLEMLRDLLIQASHTPKIRRKTRPTKASKARRLDAKRHRGQIKSTRRSLD